MNPADIPYHPVASKTDVQRLVMLSPPMEAASDLWTEVHREAQTRLESLAAEVRQRIPDVQVCKGRTEGECFFLFTYLTFSLSGGAIDPVVAGMTFVPAASKIQIESDVSGEQAGDLIFSLPKRVVSYSKEELIEVSIDLSGGLQRSAEMVVAALKDPSRRAD